MPVTIRGGFSKTLDLGAVKAANFDYTYPFDINLKPGEPEHDRLRDMVLDRAVESHNVMHKRFPSWREIDRSMTAFIDIDDDEKAVLTKDNREPVSIVVPTMYANLQVLLTYTVASLLSENPFKYEGVAGEDVPKAILMEHHIEQQFKNSKMILPLHTLSADGYKYGMGIVVPEFVTKVSPNIRSFEVVDEGLFSKQFVTPSTFTNRILFEGNEIRVIDPYKFLPDVNYPSHEVEKMEYVGWAERASWMSLLKTEKLDQSYFNMRYLKFVDGRSDLFDDDDTNRDDKTEISTDFENTIYSKPIDYITMFIDLIPSDWGLGAVDDPELWLFRIAGDQVIISAEPVNLLHGMKPVRVVGQDFDGHSISPVSRMEMDYPIQHGINWMYNNHVTNMRKAVNNMLVVDPGLANYNDVTDTRTGAVIRMRKAVWGLGRIKDAVMQLPINDVTRGNIADAAWLMDVEDRVTAAQDSVSGAISQKKERVSSFESRQAAQSSVSRLVKDSKITFAQVYQDLAFMLAMNTVQFMSEDTFVKISGRLPADIEEEFKLNDPKNRQRVKVSREMFEDFRFNVMVQDGTIPGSHNDPQSLIQFYQILTSNPDLLQKFDIVKITKAIARTLDIKEDFSRRINASVQPNAAVQQQVQSGQLQPVGGGNGRG